MPLPEASDPECVKKAIEELTKANASKPAGKKRSHEQIVAIALQNCHKSKQKK